MSDFRVEKFDFTKHTYILNTTGLICSEGPNLDKTLKSLEALQTALQKTPTRILHTAIRLTDALVKHLNTQNSGGIISTITAYLWKGPNYATQVSSLQTTFQRAHAEAEQREHNALQTAFTPIKEKTLPEKELEKAFDDIRLMLVCASDPLQKTTLFQEVLSYYVKHACLQLAKNQSHNPQVTIDTLIELDPDLDFLSEFERHAPHDAAINQVLTAILQKKESNFLYIFFTRTYWCVYEHFKNPPTKRLFLITLALFEVGKKHFANSGSESLSTTWLTLSEKIPQEIPLNDLLSDFICQIAELSLHDNRYKLLLEEALRHLLAKDSACESLYRIIVQNMQHQLLEAIVVALEAMFVPTQEASKMDRLMRRFLQISSCLNHNSRLSKREAFLLAYFIESDVATGFTNHYYNKKKCALPRSLQSEAATGDLVVILTRKDDLYVYPEGTSKRSSPVLYIPSDTTKSASLSCRTVNFTKFKNPDGSDFYTTKERGQIILQEALWHKRLTGIRGIWPQTTMHYYTKTVIIKTDKQEKEVEIPRISVISPLGTSLVQFYKTHEPQAFCFILDLVIDLAYGLDALHKMELIHGDIKALNALYKRKFDSMPDTTATAGWIDFGHLFTIAELKENPQCLKGTYGTLAFTAPELIGKKTFDKDLKKLDVWAFGCMLYKIFLGKKPSWQLNILEKITDHTISHEEISKMYDMIDDEIERPFKELEKITNRSWQQELRYVICCALRFHPDNRWDMEKICAYLEHIYKKIPQQERLAQKIPPPLAPDASAELLTFSIGEELAN